mmetsp:Transcript_12654/g.30237  ORF Transcript_12654/g.30237 Transcript_12654/m.30237 type:complete len:201 (-) Transcript_12654:917-1519(-)
MRVPSAGRAHPDDGHRTLVSLREARNRALVQLGLLGSTDRVLVTSIRGVLASLLELGVGDLVCLCQQLHTQIHSLAERRDLEHSTSQPWAIFHRLHQVSDSLQVLRAHLLVLASLLSFLGHLLQLADRILEVLQLFLLVHQLNLGLPHILDPLRTLVVERRHFSTTFLFDGVFACGVITCSACLFHQVFDHEETLPPLLL